MKWNRILVFDCGFNDNGNVLEYVLMEIMEYRLE